MAFTISTIYKAIDKMSPIIKQMEQANFAFSRKTVQSIERANNSLNSLQKVTGGAVSKIMNLKNAAIVVGGTIVVKKLWEGALNIAKIGDEAANTGRMLGISAEALQELRFASDQQNVTNESLTNSLRFLNRNVGELRLGSGSLYTNLKKTNPQLLQQLQHVKNNEEAFTLITNALNKLPSQFERSSLAQAAFGRSGIDMLKLTEAGTGGIQKLREEARKYGGIISNEVAAKMDDFLDAQSRMKKAMFGLKVELLIGLIPTFHKITENLTNWIINNRELIKNKISQWVEKISKAIKWLSDHFEDIIKILKKVALAFAGLLFINSVISILSGAIQIFTGVIWLWNSALLANPLFWIVVAILAAIAAVAILVWKWKEITAWWEKSKTILKLLLLPIIIGNAALIMLAAGIRKVIDHWAGFKKAFAEGGFLKGIKEIGKVLLSWVLMPLQFVLKLLAKIPGFKLAQNMSDDLSKFREGLEAETLIKKEEAPKEEPVAEKPVNIKKAQSEDIKKSFNYEEIINKLQIEFTNKSDKNANVKSNPAIIPVTTSTF